MTYETVTGDMIENIGTTEQNIYRDLHKHMKKLGERNVKRRQWNIP